MKVPCRRVGRQSGAGVCVCWPPAVDSPNTGSFAKGETRLYLSPLLLCIAISISMRILLSTGYFSLWMYCVMGKWIIVCIFAS